MKDDHVRDERVLVYSTDGSTPLPQPPKQRQPQQRPGAGLPDDGIVRVTREKRRASAVTVVHGLTSGEIENVGKELRRHCGTGGTAKNGVVELQGDHRDKVVSWFEARGRRVKRAGG